MSKMATMDAMINEVKNSCEKSSADFGDGRQAKVELHIGKGVRVIIEDANSCVVYQPEQAKQLLDWLRTWVEDEEAASPMPARAIRG